MRKPSLKKIDEAIDVAFRSRCNGVQIAVLDIPKVFKAGREAAALGQGIEAAVVSAVEGLRKN